MKLLLQIAFIARIEARYFARFPKLFLATAVVAIIPALYAVIYLSSVWDPESKTGALAVGLVNLDQGVEYREHVFNVGWEVAARLKSSQRFGFVSYDNEAVARHHVREGSLAFALIIPKDFSSNAVPGAQAGNGKLVVYTSEGNNFESAAIAKHFAETLGHDVNESLNERRWALVLRNAAGSQHNVNSLRDGLHQLRTGAKELSSATAQSASGSKALRAGAQRLNTGVEQFTHGFNQISAGVRAIDAQRPTPSDLNRLKSGADTLAAGHAELGAGLVALQGGTQRLMTGAYAFQNEAKDSLFISSTVADNLDQLNLGLGQLDKGLKFAGESQQKLAEGATQLSSGVEALTTGVRSLSSGVHSITSKLPDGSQLDVLNQGAEELAASATKAEDASQKISNGAQRLAVGVDLLAGSLPAAVPDIGGSAQGLAQSVLPSVEVDAEVHNSGSGFAPNVIPAALWLGAGIAAFLIHVRVLPRQARSFSRPVRLFGKIMLPSLVVLVQAALVYGAALVILKIHVLHPLAFAFTLAAASVTFLLIVFALTRALGDAGKGMAMLLLAVQLSSSGGIVPIELSGGWFAEISPWLPITWVVRALKASMFGAYNNDWQSPLLWIGCCALLAMTLASTVGRWRYVKTNTIRPAIDF